MVLVRENVINAQIFISTTKTERKKPTKIQTKAEKYILINFKANYLFNIVCKRNHIVHSFVHYNEEWYKTRNKNKSTFTIYSLRAFHTPQQRKRKKALRLLHTNWILFDGKKSVSKKLRMQLVAPRIQR